MTERALGTLPGSRTANAFSSTTPPAPLAGFAVPAGPGVRHFRGIADETVDNSAGSAGAASVEIITPEAAYWDSAATFTQADVGQPVYFSDDHTVTLTAGTNTYAGRIKSVDQYGVLVDMRGAYVEPALPVTSAPTTAA